MDNLGYNASDMVGLYNYIEQEEDLPTDFESNSPDYINIYFNGKNRYKSFEKRFPLGYYKGSILDQAEKCIQDKLQLPLKVVIVNWEPLTNVIENSKEWDKILDEVENSSLRRIIGDVNIWLSDKYGKQISEKVNRYFVVS